MREREREMKRRGGVDRGLHATALTHHSLHNPYPTHPVCPPGWRDRAESGLERRGTPPREEEEEVGAWVCHARREVPNTLPSAAPGDPIIAQVSFKRGLRVD